MVTSYITVGDRGNTVQEQQHDLLHPSRPALGVRGDDDIIVAKGVIGAQLVHSRHLHKWRVYYAMVPDPSPQNKQTTTTQHMRPAVTMPVSHSSHEHGQSI